MEQNNNSNNGLADEANASGKNKIEDMENWRNEHGQPDFEYLQSLVEDGGPGALEKLRSIAEDFDVKHGPDTPAEDLVREIRSSERNDPTTTT